MDGRRKEVENFEKALVRAYKQTRDLPFWINIGQAGNLRETLKDIKIRKKGSCSSKHYLLGSLCEKLGMSVTYLTHPFYWQGLGVAYPDSIKRLVDKMSLQYHLALKVSSNSDSFILDATWDPPLEKAGFPINRAVENLRDLEDTRIAVVPSGECIIHKTATERERFIKRALNGMNVDRVLWQGFFTSFNEWVEGIRKT